MSRPPKPQIEWDELWASTDWEEPMFDSEYFLTGLPMQVAEYHHSAFVRILTYDLGDFLVRDVTKTYSGAVSLNVWLDSAGLAPIVAGSSSDHEFDVLPPTDYKAVTIPFEQIVTVVVVHAPGSASGRFTLQ